jgi:sulfatase maturation enzyme AslB (radical SAM superfamily)
MDTRLDDFSPKSVGNKDFQFCGYQMFTFQIGCDSLVYPCCVEKYNKQFAFGDIIEQDLKEIIFGKERKKYIQNFDVNKCLPCWLKHKNKAIEYLCLGDPPHINFV